MIIKNYINKISDFIIKRLAELVGIFLVASSILLFISLISYSPEDPNFIFHDNQDIKNILGFRGSFIADIFFQSIGIISLLIRVFSGHRPEDILEAKIDFIEKIGLNTHLSQTRANGLLAMIKQIKIYALAYQSKR